MTPSHIQHQEQCDRLPTLTSHSTAPTLLSQHPLRFLMHQRSNSSCTSSRRKRTKFRVTSRNAVPTFSIFVGKLRKSAIPSYSIYPYWLPWVSTIFKSHNLKDNTVFLCSNGNQFLSKANVYWTPVLLPLEYQKYLYLKYLPRTNLKKEVGSS